MIGDQPEQPKPVLRVAILGSTGSIGSQTLQTVNHLNTLQAQDKHPTRYDIVALAANNDTATLARQSYEHPEASIGVCCPSANTARLNHTSLLHAQDAPTTLLERTHPDIVIASIVGIAGLQSTLKAAQLGIDIALANKESLVAGGQLVVKAAKESGAKILPLDSEHAGLWQCLLGITAPNYTPPAPTPSTIRRVTLTASGGPFRTLTTNQIQNATVDQALNHPTWNMGRKITIDSATLMNKALELVEAHQLFGLSANQLHAVIHPQSVVHAFLETIDGSTIAHLGPTDMRCPIQHALTHPHRATTQSDPIDLSSLNALNFEPIDPARFPAIAMAKQAIDANNSSAPVLNAANEAAVEAFLNQQISFGSITQIIERTLNLYDHHPVDSLESVLNAHTRSMSIASQQISNTTHATK